MPIAWDRQDPSIQYTVVCQSATSLDTDNWQRHAKVRYIIIFIVGNFTLDEANEFAIEAFDNVVIPDKDLFFEDPPAVSSTAFSAVRMPQGLEYIVNNFSTVDFIDEYTFHVLYHIIDNFFQLASKSEENARRRAKKRQDEMERLEIATAGESA